jgi:uncharacterized protein YsxB (DUF464 family)
MIWVKFETRKNEFVSMEVTGHAGYDEYGKDIVCAAVSAITGGALNAIDIMETNSCELIDEENRTYVKVLNNSEKLQAILETVYHQLNTIAVSYGDYLRVERTEVKS